MENKKPRHYLILKIVGFVFVVVAIAGIVLTITGFGDFENNNFMIGGFMTCIGFFVGVSCLIFGFGPEMSRLATKSAKYIQQQNKDDLIDISNTNADIASGAVVKLPRQLKKVLKKKINFVYTVEKVSLMMQNFVVSVEKNNRDIIKKDCYFAVSFLSFSITLSLSFSSITDSQLFAFFFT